MHQQIHFTSESSCPRFSPNSFRKDLCQLCQCKIQAHSDASPEDVANALEYSVDRVASRVWTGKDFPNAPSVFVGGFKSPLNKEFLRSNSVKLVVNTAPSLVGLFGPKYVQLKKAVAEDADLSGTEWIDIDWEDKVEQVLGKDVVVNAVKRMLETVGKGGSVLVHCAQGKSRSAALAVAFVAKVDGKSVPDALRHIQEARQMAQPNSSFMAQLRAMEKEGVFKTSGD